jgi:hypothetical protein
LKKLIDHAQTLVTPFNDEKETPPDPSFVLTLPDEVLSGANLYAVQKTFDGSFSFDVYYQSGSTSSKIDGMSQVPFFSIYMLTIFNLSYRSFHWNQGF